MSTTSIFRSTVLRFSSGNDKVFNSQMKSSLNNLTAKSKTAAIATTTIETITITRATTQQHRTICNTDYVYENFQPELPGVAKRRRNKIETIDV